MKIFDSSTFNVEFNDEISQTARLAFFDLIQHPACHWGLRMRSERIVDEFQSSNNRTTCRLDVVNCVGVDTAADDDIVNGRRKMKMKQVKANFGRKRSRWDNVNEQQVCVNEREKCSVERRKSMDELTTIIGGSNRWYTCAILSIKFRWILFIIMYIRWNATFTCART